MIIPDTRQRPKTVYFMGRTYYNRGRYYDPSWWYTDGRKRLHQVIRESVHRREIKGWFHVHHRDWNTYNNDISNLEEILWSEHCSNHTKERLKDEWYRNKNREHLERIRDMTKIRHWSEQWRQRHVEHGKKTRENKKQHTKVCWMCWKTYKTRFPTRSKRCHLNCKAKALRERRRSL